MRRRKFSSLLAAMVPAFAVTPIRLAAQSNRLPVIGTLNILGPITSLMDAYLQGLAETGYIEGRTVSLEHRSTEGRPELLPEMAAELVARKVDVICSGSGAASARAARNATSIIPIVSTFTSDPVVDGLVTSLSRPGGNLTGVSYLTIPLYAKRFELLSDLAPKASKICVVIDPNSRNIGSFMRVVQQAAMSKGRQLELLKVGTEADIDDVLGAALKAEPKPLLVAASLMFFRRKEQIAALAARYSVPGIYPSREYVAAGGLISYAANLQAVFKQVGIYAGKILNGASVADLPVVQPTTFELSLNMSTARALGINVPRSILGLATDVLD